MIVQLEKGNIVNASTQVIVNAWNQNIIPWFLLLPMGVSREIKKRAGFKPFNELLTKGLMKLGSAVITSAGKLPFTVIIHVAGINMFWQASEKSIQRSVQSAMAIVNGRQFLSVAFPIIGAGSGGFDEEKALNLMIKEFGKISSNANVKIIQFRKYLDKKG